MNLKGRTPLTLIYLEEVISIENMPTNTPAQIRARA